VFAGIKGHGHGHGDGAAASTDELLAAVDLAEKASSLVSELSGGQKR
jgi:ABC-type polar amino acid transport system ATPase subunit